MNKKEGKLIDYRKFMYQLDDEFFRFTTQRDMDNLSEHDLEYLQKLQKRIEKIHQWRLVDEANRKRAA